MATSNVYKQKLLYLGRGVDCRKGVQEWLPDLERYSGDRIREISDNYRENPLSCFRVTTNRSENTTDVGIGGEIKIRHGFIPIDLGSGFLVELNSKKTAMAKRTSIISRTATLPDAVKDDPGAIEVPSNAGNLWHSEFEKNLCAHILRTNDTEFRKLFQTAAGDAIPQEDDHAISTFNDLIKRAKEKNESNKFWQLVYNALISFLDEKEHTHYVYTITLGAERAESDSDEISGKNVKLNLSVQAPAAEASVTANVTKKREDHASHAHGRGRIETDSGGNSTIAIEEVIEIGVKPLASLISNKQLKLIMQAVFNNYKSLETSQEFGPYRIFCREQSSGEQDIYWCINANQVYATRKPEEASHFYITIYQKSPLRFYITYKTSKGTKLMVIVKQPYDSHHLLQLLHAPWEKGDYLYTLEPQNVANQSTIPLTPSEWQERSPFFIRHPGKWWEWILFKGKRYTKMEKCSEESTPEYQMTCTTMDADKCDMMLFYFEKVINLEDGQGTIAPHSVGPSTDPESTTENGDSLKLWKIPEDEEIKDATDMFYELVGTEEILL